MQNPNRITSVEKCLDWAFRASYIGAKQAANDYAAATGAALTLRDVGQYGYGLSFHDNVADAEAAVQAAPMRHKHPSD